MNTTTLLPDPTRFRLEYIASTANAVTLIVTSIQATGKCPLCGCASSRIHSRYRRTLADLPWNQVAIRLRLGVRKFFCANALCPRVIFTEPLPGFAARYARKTLRLNEVLYLSNRVNPGTPDLLVNSGQAVAYAAHRHFTLPAASASRGHAADQTSLVRTSVALLTLIG